MIRQGIQAPSARRGDEGVVGRISFADFGILLEERIGFPLLTDPRRRTMPGVNQRVCGQGEELFPDVRHKQSAVAAGEVVAADAAPEQDVAAEQVARLIAIQINHVAGRVPWDVQDFQANAALFHHVSFSHHLIGGRTGDGEAKRSAEISLGIGQLGCVLPANEKRGLGKSLLESGIAGNVVDMAVGD